MVDITKLYQAIQKDLSKLSGLLKTTSEVSALVAKVPPVLAGQENLAIKPFQLESLVGARAREAAAKCYADLHIRSPYSQKASRRTIGVLHFWPEAKRRQQLTSLVQAINHAKLEFKTEIISNYKTRMEKFNAIHEACPGVMTNHLYRTISLIEEQHVQSFSLSWLHNDKVERVPKETLLQELSDAYETAESQVKFIYANLLAQVAATPEELLRLRRPNKLRVSRNIKMNCDKLPANVKANSVAPMPVIVVQPERFMIKPIPNYDPDAKSRRTRSDKAHNIQLGTFAGKTIEKLAN